MHTHAVLYKLETCDFCGFCGQFVIWEIFILEILLVKICLVAIGEQGMCEETFDICKHAATEAEPERLHIVRPYLTLSTILLMSGQP